MGAEQVDQAACVRGQWHAPVHVDSDHFDKDYQVMDLIGKGGFGEVCLALRVATGEEVAMKILRTPPSLATPGEKEEWSSRIRQEVETMAKCTSPYITQVIEAYDLSDRESRWCIALELCTGCNLSEILNQIGVLDAISMRTISAQLASAVLHMHLHGVVHRDLKPANVMVEGGELQGAATSIKLVDFGLAHGLDKRFIRRYQQALLRQVRELAKEAAPSPRKGHMASPMKEWLSPTNEWIREISPVKGLIRHLSPTKARDGDDLGSVQSPEIRNSQTSRVSQATFRAAPAGTRAYAAPEVIQKREMVDIPVSSDAYSVGAIMRHCASGVAPDEDVADKLGGISFAVRMVKSCLGKPVATYRFLSQVPEDQRLLIKELMQRDPADRMTVVQLCKSAYISEAAGVVGNPFSATAADLGPPGDEAPTGGQGATAADGLSGLPTAI